MLHQGCTRLVIVFSDGIVHGTLVPNSSAFKAKFDSRCLTKSPCFRHKKNELHLILTFHSQNLKKMFQRLQKGLSPMYVYVFIRETYRKPLRTFYIHLVECRYCGIRQGRRTLYFVSFAFSSPSWTASENHTMGHVNEYPTKQLLTRISSNTQSKSDMLSLTECVWKFQNNALWDTQ